MADTMDYGISWTLKDYIEYVKLNLTAGIIELEIEDEVIGKYVNMALSEINRYIDQPILVTTDYAKCIDLTKFTYTDESGEHNWHYNAITHVYRTEGFTGDIASGISSSAVDPMYAQMWMAFSGGTAYTLKNYVYNYLSYNTLLQMRNTTSTDLAFKEDKAGQKLYINCNYDVPKKVTIEFIPIYTDVRQITADYWMDMLKRLSLALVKIGLGRARTRFKQTNALWDQDGETLLQEGNEELKELRETLRVNSSLFYPLD